MCQIIYHPGYNKYNLGPDHPFNPKRVEMMLSLLQEYGCLKEPIQPELLGLKNFFLSMMNTMSAWLKLQPR